jgi:hypothetical protein
MMDLIVHDSSSRADSVRAAAAVPQQGQGQPLAGWLQSAAAALANGVVDKFLGGLNAFGT